MARIVFDIETIGENFDELDTATQESLTAWIRKESRNEEEYQASLADVKEGLGFSPLTGQIVAIGVLDCEKDKGAIYFQSPGASLDEFEEKGISFKPMTEGEMLTHFWDGARHYDEFVSFNGRAFDAPFLAIRSAILGIRPSKDLLSNRYLGSQRPGARHVDLLDQLTFYGAPRKKGNLHLWCRAFGIESPKVSGTTGDDVGRLFREGKFADIARYNAGDLRATSELYNRWATYVRM